MEPRPVVKPLTVRTGGLLFLDPLVQQLSHQLDIVLTTCLNELFFIFSLFLPCVAPNAFLDDWRFGAFLGHDGAAVDIDQHELVFWLASVLTVIVAHSLLLIDDEVPSIILWYFVFFDPLDVIFILNIQYFLLVPAIKLAYMKVDPSSNRWSIVETLKEFSIGS